MNQIRNSLGSQKTIFRKSLSSRMPFLRKSRKFLKRTGALGLTLVLFAASVNLSAFSSFALPAPGAAAASLRAATPADAQRSTASDASKGAAAGKTGSGSGSASVASASDAQIVFEDGELLDGTLIDDLSEELPENLQISGQAQSALAAAAQAATPAAPAAERKEAGYPAFEQSVTVDGIVVTVQAEEGVFPEGAELWVQKVSAAHSRAAEDAVAGQREENRSVAAAYTFDIKVLDGEGEELQPADGQSVRVCFAMAEAADQNLEAAVYHLTEEGDAGSAGASSAAAAVTGEEDEENPAAAKTSPESGVPLTAEKLETEADAASGTVSAETESFSLYTVEFTYQSLQYVLPGGAGVRLAEILETIGLTGTPTAVEISDSALFSASEESGEWVITSHQPFSSTEWMKVTINGIIYEITVTDAATVTSWAALRDALLAGGDVTLGGNITITDADISASNYLFVGNDKTAVLDLNGKTLTGGGSNATITVSSGGTLTIKDSSSAKNGKITGGDRAGNGGGIEVEYNGEFTLQSGTISGNTANYGGGVHVHGGTFTMTGGTISANSSSYGGGVDISASSSYNGTFTMSGGTISGNTPSAAGGGVRVGSNCTFTMSGGTISGNRAGNNGGGVLLANGAEFNMSAGNITDNTAGSDGNGGGVYVGGSESVFTMSGGTISGNSVPGSAAWGGGVCNLGTFTMSGGSIINNSCEGRGGGLYANGTNYLQGNIKISGNKNGSQNSNVYTMKRLIITGALTNTTPIGITTNTAPEYPSSSHTDGLVVIFTSGLNGKGNASKFTPDEDMHEVILYSDSTYTNEAAMSLKYTVTVTPVTYSHMSKTSGANPQSVIMENAIANIVYTADTGYHFPTNYASLGTTNGLTVTRTSDTKITISGTPRYGSSAVNLSLAAASPISATSPSITVPSAVSMSYGDTGKTVSVTATAATGHTITGYQWYQNTTNSNTGGTAVSGATSASYSIPQKTAAGTYYYYCVVSTKRTDNNQTTTGTSSAAKVTVGKRTAVLSWTNTSLTYNRSSQKPTCTVSNLLSGDTCSVTVGGAQTNAGTYTATASALTGTAAANYQLPSANTTSFTIAKKSVTVSGIKASNKTYNGSTAATLDTSSAVFTGIVSGDTLTVSGTGTFNNKNAGTGKTVTISGLTLGGASAGNYSLAASGNQTTTTANITKSTVSVSSGITASNKTYDGDTAATLDTSGAVFAGLFDGDTLTVTGTGTFDNPNVGTGKTVTISGLTLGGASAGNYSLSPSGQTTTTASITAKAVTVSSGITASDKTYDGNTSAALNISGAVFDGIVDGDSLTVSGTGTFDNPDVGTGKTVTISDLILGGASAGNYSLATSGNQDTTTASITEKAVRVSGITAEDKVYDGGISVTLDYSGAAFDGLLAGDSLSVTATGAFSDPAVGSGKTVTITGLTLGGVSAGNYALSSEGQQESTTASILAHEVTVSGIAAEDKVYDGDTSAVLDFSGTVFSYTAAGDELTVTGTGSFDTKDIGTGKTVAISDLTLGGASAGNYALAASGNQTTATASITEKEIGLSWGTATFTYTGLPLAPEAEATGLVGSDACSVSVSGEQTDAGSYTAAAVSLSNANYRLPAAVTKEFTIAKAPLTVTTQDAEKIYDGTPVTAGGTLGGLVNGETATLTVSGSQTEVGSSANTCVIAWDGTAKEANYALESETLGTLTVTEYAGEITVTTTGGTFVYDGKPHGATVSVSALPAGYILVAAESGAAATDVTGSSGSAGGGMSGSIPATADILVIQNAAGVDVTNRLNTTKVDGSITITPAPLTVTTMDGSRVYDGTPLTAAGELAGLVNGETATFTTTGSQTEAGNSENGYSLVWDGTAKEANYALESETLGSLTVTPREVTVSGISAVARDYDGSTNAALDFSGAVISGLVAGDDLQVTAAGSFEDKEIGAGKTVRITGLALTGKDAGNYALAASGNQETATADILRPAKPSSGQDDGEDELAKHWKPTESSVDSGTWSFFGESWFFTFENGHQAADQWVYTGWQGQAGWYRFRNDGVMLVGWYHEDGFTYYLNPAADGQQGRMLIGWQLIDGKWYFFEPQPGKNQGHMYVNTTTPDGYWVGADGAWTGE